MAFFASGMVGRLRKSSEIIRNCRKMAENSFIRDTKQNNIGLFEADFASFWKKFTVSKNFLLLVLKCLKFNSVSCYIEIPSCLVILSKYSIMNSIRRGIDSIAFTWMVTNVFYGTEAFFGLLCPPKSVRYSRLPLDAKTLLKMVTGVGFCSYSDISLLWPDFKAIEPFNLLFDQNVRKF